MKSGVEAARALGATDDQIRLAAGVGVVAKRGSERETDNALKVALDVEPDTACCSAPAEETASVISSWDVQ